ncbi:MAG: PKD domain-containing protein, partial [Bacteroidetes bacterium]
PNPIAAPDSTTTYSVLVIDDCNNPFTDTITVFVDGDTVFFELGNDTTLCQGQPLRLDATSFGDDTVTYRWNTGATTPTLTPTRSGRYSVTVTVDEFCVADDRIRVEFIPLPSAALPPDTTFCLGDSLWLAASFPDATITWQDGSQTDSFLVLESGTYAVTVSNPCGEAESSIDVLVEDCEQVFFPNVFSPDGDGINDRFHPLDGGDVEIVEIFQVFDRWGGLVHEAKDFLPNDPKRGWDGRVGGRDAVPGVYVWWARVRFRNGVEARLEGDVLLIR